MTEGEVAGVAAASLTADEQDVYDTAARTPLSDDTKAQLASKLRELIPTLPTGIGVGPSGWSYEHIKALFLGGGADTVVIFCS